MNKRQTVIMGKEWDKVEEVMKRYSLNRSAALRFLLQRLAELEQKEVREGKKIPAVATSTSE